MSAAYGPEGASELDDTAVQLQRAIALVNMGLRETEVSAVKIDTSRGILHRALEGTQNPNARQAMELADTLPPTAQSIQEAGRLAVASIVQFAEESFGVQLDPDATGQ